MQAYSDGDILYNEEFYLHAIKTDINVGIC